MQIDEANRAIRAKAAEPGMNAMGATVVAVIKNGAATIAWVGDCRAYLWRRAELRLLTRDHTVVQEADRGHARRRARGPSRTARRHPCRSRRRGAGRCRYPDAAAGGGGQAGAVLGRTDDGAA
ncbi:MAG: hypothetical protein U1E41_02975 [Paracoccus sp. (in: a-proteobacteria)]